MAVITATLACLFAYLVLAPPVEVRVDSTPAAWSVR